jgi:hypothetical protein
VAKALPAAKIQPPINASRRYESEIDVQRPQLRAFATAGPAAGGGACGLPPAPLNGSLPNVLVIGAIPGNRPIFSARSNFPDVCPEPVLANVDRFSHIATKKHAQNEGLCCCRGQRL